MGRPSKGERVAITARLTDDQCDKLDAFAEVAGVKTRSEAISAMVDLAEIRVIPLEKPAPPAAQRVVKGLKIPGVKPVESAEHDVQFGPTRAKPGERLKKGPKK